MGRPKQFDRDEALDSALELFWQLGYHDASVRRLSAAMGVNVATVFSEFGDKEGLYLEALARYEAAKVPFYIGSLEHDGADVETIITVLRAFASFAKSGTAPGCLITNSAVELAPNPARSQQALLRYVERLQRAYAHALGEPRNPGSRRGGSGQAQSLAATTLGLFVMIRAKLPAAIVAQVVDGTIATLPDRTTSTDSIASGATRRTRNTRKDPKA